MNNNEKGKILVLRRNDTLFSILINNNRILSIQANNPMHDHTGIGNIYIGKVKNVSTNIGAAFVEIANSQITFLSLQEAKDTVLTNRKPDGTIKAGDELLVQLVKEPIKNKLAGVSAKLSLTGSYVIIENRQSQTERKIRISSKLGAKYSHIYKYSPELMEIAEKFNIIIRTNTQSAGNISEVIEQAQTLAGKMEHILEIGDKRTCFSCLYQCEPRYITFIKNCYQSEYDEIVTDKKDIYEELLADSILKGCKIRLYEDKMLPLYKLYSIETRIRELTDKKVWLKSGAYLVIEPTEALTAIDVNTGKYESHKNPEETYFKINLEAAQEIAAALRARNISGIIIVDFINMSNKEHIDKLTQYMKDILKKDVVPANVVDITELGLMEITRKKKDRSFAEQIKGCYQKGVIIS